MSSTQPSVQIESEEGQTRVRVAGQWTLIADPEGRERAWRELVAVPDPRGAVWDLREVEVLDSAGALLLWRLWGRQLPAGLQCHEQQRSYFDRLADLAGTASEPPWRWWHPLVRIGEGIYHALHAGGQMLLLLGQILVSAGFALRNPRFLPWTELSATIYKAGLRSVVLLGVINFLIGMVMGYQMGLEIAKYGANTAIVGVLSIAILREIGPWITAIILAGRTGSAITAEIGSMHLTGELSALRTFGVSPVLRLAFPRVLGLAIAMPLLVVWADFTGMVGGMVVADASLGISPSLFLERLPHDVDLTNFWIGVAKGVINGVIIGLVASYYGLYAEPSTESLSRQTTASVVTTLSLVLVLDAGVGALLAGAGVI